MDIKKLIEQKTKELERVSQEIGQLSQVLNLKNQEALRLDGAVNQLQDLDKEEPEKNND